MMRQDINPPQITEHIVVRHKHYIVLLGGKNGYPEPDRVFFTYNLYTGEWRKCVFSKRTLIPYISSRGCGATIGEDIHISHFTKPYHRVNDSIWRLTRSEDGCLTWNIIREKFENRRPSPRKYHTAWEYGGNFWIFGGKGPKPLGVNQLKDYGDFSDSCNNQLLQFNIDSGE